MKPKGALHKWANSISMQSKQKYSKKVDFFSKIKHEPKQSILSIKLEQTLLLV